MPFLQRFLATYPEVLSIAFGLITTLAGLRAQSMKRAERSVWISAIFLSGAFTVYSVIASRDKQARDTAEIRRLDRGTADSLRATQMRQQSELFEKSFATMREMAAAPTGSLRRKVLALSADVMAFHIDRSEPPGIMFGGIVEPLTDEQRAEFDAETVRQYRNRFAVPVADVISDLKAYGLSDRDLDDMSLRDPDLDSMWRIGQGLKRLADKLR